jgi:hypothetical protein
MSQDDIVESMARTLWVSAYASYAEENPRKRGVVHARGGQNWHDVAPETPPAAERAAGELAELFKVKNNASLEQLAQRARVADGKKIDEEDFGHYLAMMAMGEGVGWWDDHKRFDLKVPRFEVMYDGRSLEWSGETITVQPKLPGVNPAGLTAKGERMYGKIKAGYGADPRAAEIASRTVLARSREIPGLKKRNPERHGAGYKHSEDDLAHAYLLRMPAGNEVDAAGVARATKMTPIAAEQALDRLVAAGDARKNGKWYSATPRRNCR